MSILYNLNQQISLQQNIMYRKETGIVNYINLRIKVQIWYVSVMHMAIINCLFFYKMVLKQREKNSSVSI